MATRFSEQSDEHRMGVRKSVDLCGGDVIGYNGNGFSVAIKQGRFADICQALEAWGYRNSKLVYFPLCSDHPEPSYRHDYKGQKACMWLYGQFEPID